MIRRLNIVITTIPIPSKVIYRFNEIPVEISVVFFFFFLQECKKLIPKFTPNCKGPQVAKTILKKSQKVKTVW